MLLHTTLLPNVTVKGSLEDTVENTLFSTVYQYIGYFLNKHFPQTIYFPFGNS